MQIVRDLAGYSLGRSDLLRRAMSKKKESVMQKERHNFVYGNEEEEIPGCIKNGISEEVANRIYDKMIDFAKYAFNKSHAAAYAVVAYETAYLKQYYPVEFMAALMTSFIENSSKVSQYIVICRNMGIDILPPDINKGERDFSVENGKIRYGLSALKSVGKSVIDSIVEERNNRGEFVSLNDFVVRLTGKEVNKRTIESFIKAGAFDSFGLKRRQLMMIYVQVVDSIARDKKNNMAGQMTLFDFAAEDDKRDYEVRVPEVAEFTKLELLAFEKEVIGVYVSGHPLEEYMSVWKKKVTAVSSDFVNEDNEMKVKDGNRETIGGLVTSVTMKTTKSNKVMAFFTLEDIYGTVEVIVFPKDFERYRFILKEDERLFVTGRVSANDEGNGKIICENILLFDDVPSQLWIRFDNKEEYVENENELLSILEEAAGKDTVIIYLNEEKQKKTLTKEYSVKADSILTERLKRKYGEKNIAIK